MNKSLFLIPLAGMMMACSHKVAKPAAPSSGADSATISPVPVEPIASKPLGMVLKASAFRMTGDYSDNVAITIDGQGNITYYPAPTDITDNSRPLDLGGGWWLNRQGISANSVFTRYTFDEYRKLQNTPSPQELKAAVIPGARVSEMVKLPVPASQAESSLPEIKDYLKSL